MGKGKYPYKFLISSKHKEKYEGHKANVQDAPPTCNKQLREGNVNPTQRPIFAETDNNSGLKTAAKTGSVK